MKLDALYSTIMELKQFRDNGRARPCGPLYSTIMELKPKSASSATPPASTLYSTIMELKHGFKVIYKLPYFLFIAPLWN